METEWLIDGCGEVRAWGSVCKLSVSTLTCSHLVEWIRPYGPGDFGGSRGWLVVGKGGFKTTVGVCWLLVRGCFPSGEVA